MDGENLHKRISLLQCTVVAFSRLTVDLKITKSDDFGFFAMYIGSVLGSFSMCVVRIDRFGTCQKICLQYVQCTYRQIRNVCQEIRHIKRIVCKDLVPRRDVSCQFFYK